MRGAVFGFIGALLATGSAQAASCHPGYFVVEGQAEDGAARILRADGLGIRLPRPASSGVSRTIIRGVSDGKPFILDGVFGPHMAPTFTSYAGRRAEKGPAVAWERALPREKWPAGATLFVGAGPLSGVWTARCLK